MEIKCTYQKLVPIVALKENPKNAELHPYNDDLVERLAKVIKYQGIRKPIVVSKLSGFIVTGHATKQALEKLGIKEAPVDFQDFENNDQEIAHLIADNSLNAWREINYKAVNEFLPEFDGMDFDIDFLGIEDFKVEPMEIYDLDEKEEKSKDKPYVLELTFPTESEMTSVYDEFCSRGYIVKVK